MSIGLGFCTVLCDKSTFPCTQEIKFLMLRSHGVIRKIVPCLIMLGMVTAPSLGNAQRAPGGPSGDIPRFMELGPKVGEQLPDLTIFDDMGNPVSVREITKGNYSVLVLGCLT